MSNTGAKLLSNVDNKLENILMSKILILGDAGVGKTSILNRYCENEYSRLYNATIGVDIKIRIEEIDGKNVKLVMYDTSGQQRFERLIDIYYDDIKYFIVVFDLTDDLSFSEVSSILQKIYGKSKKPYIILVGNKDDLKTKRVIDQQTIGTLIDNNKISKYFEISARTGSGINELFKHMADKLIVDDSSNVKSVRFMINNDIKKPTDDVMNDNIIYRYLFRFFNCFNR